MNFGYSKGDYEALTPREKAFVYKAWENKMVSESYQEYNAMFTAVYNVHRPKRKRALKLWKKPQVRRADREVIHKNLQIIREVERADGNAWVERIYEKNGMKLPKGVRTYG